ncbi:unnamed protein product, partial [Rotaria magnacalcarata]
QNEIEREDGELRTAINVDSWLDRKLLSSFFAYFLLALTVIFSEISPVRLSE